MIVENFAQVVLLVIMFVQLKRSIWFRMRSALWNHRINNTLCIQCDMCRKTCPVLNEIQKGSEIIKCFAAQAEDEVRKESSSGGIFTLLAEEILKKVVLYLVLLWGQNVKYPI